MVFKRKFQRCWKKSSTLFEDKNVLIPFELWSVAMETYFVESAKKIVNYSLLPRKSIVISEASTNGIEAKVSTMLEEVVVIVWAEERLDSIWTVDCNNGDVLCGIRKKLWTTVF